MSHLKKDLLVLDRDGTLIQDYPYENKVENFRILRLVVEGLKLLKDRFDFIIHTNQSGIARGKSSLKELQEMHLHLEKEFLKEDIAFLKIFFCPHATTENCICRKPSPELVRVYAKEQGYELSKAWVFGDRGTDVDLGKNFGGNSALLLTGFGVQELNQDPGVHRRADFVAANLFQAATFLRKRKLQKIVPRNEIGKLAADLRQQGKKIVTLNGSFDLMHFGHRSILKEAKAQGDVFIVALNTDESIRGNKGPARPINSLQARQQMMSTYDEVDFITDFSEPTPVQLLEEIKPAVHVNGSEYGENCVEAPTVKKHGGRIHIFNLVEGFSTSKMLAGELNPEDAFRNS